MTDASSPKVLWHYTDANGLWGIARSSRIRFGDARFLNDRTERSYGEHLLNRVLEEEVSADPSGGTTGYRDLLREIRMPGRLYVCSFSAGAESISQWQRYGADGKGYCIGFEVERLDDVLQGIAARAAMLYDDQDQLDLLRISVKNGYARYCRGQKEEDDLTRQIHYMLSTSDIDAALLRLKSPFFRDEQEWRYIFRTQEEDTASNVINEEFALYGSYIRPFIELPRPVAGVVFSLSIVRVVCGPRLDPDVAVPSVTRFLRATGYSGDVVPSDLVKIWR